MFYRTAKVYVTLAVWLYYMYFYIFVKFFETKNIMAENKENRSWNDAELSYSQREEKILKLSIHKDHNLFIFFEMIMRQLISFPKIKKYVLSWAVLLFSAVFSTNAATFQTVYHTWMVSGFQYEQTDYLLNRDHSWLNSSSIIQPSLPLSNTILDGRAYIPRTLFGSPSKFWTIMSIDLPDLLDANNAKVEVIARNPYTEWAVSAKDFHIVMFGTQWKAEVNFVDSALLAKYTRIWAWDTLVTREWTLIRDFNNYTTIALETKNQTIKVIINWTVIYSVPYQGQLGKLVNVSLDFRGSASVDQFKIYENWSQKISESFNVDWTTTAKLSIITGAYLTWVVPSTGTNLLTGSYDFIDPDLSNYQYTKKLLWVLSKKQWAIINAAKARAIQRRLNTQPKKYDIWTLWQKVYQNFVTKSQVRSQDQWDPIDLAEWAMLYDQVLMELPWVGMKYWFQLTYNSLIDYNSPVWYWRDHNYNIYLGYDEDDGKLYFGNGQWLPIEMPEDQAMPWSRYQKTLWVRLIENTSKDFELTYSDQTKLFFKKISQPDNTVYRPYLIMDVDWNTLKLLWNDQDQLTQITDTLGNIIRYDYNGNGKISRVSEQWWRAVEFSYYNPWSADGTGDDLKSVRIINWASSKSIDFSYTVWFWPQQEELNHNLKKLVDAKGQVYVENTYDSNDAVVSQKHGADTVNFTYSRNGQWAINSVSVNNARNITTVYNFNSDGNVTSRTTNGENYLFSYDSDGNMISATSPMGKKELYIRDSLGRVTQKKIISSNNSITQTTHYSYFGDTALTASTTLPNGQQITYQRDNGGHLIQTTLSNINLGNVVATANSYFQYDTLGQLIRITDPQNRVTSFTYQNGLVSTVTKVNEVTRYNYDNYWNLVSITDPEWNIKTLNYNSFDQLSALISTEWTETKRSYDQNNSLVNLQRKISNWIYAESDFTTDLLDNTTTIINDQSASIQQQIIQSRYPHELLKEQQLPNWTKINYQYDHNDQAVKKTTTAWNSSLDNEYEYDLDGGLIKFLNARGFQTQYQRDSLGRVIRIIDANSGKTEISYDSLNLPVRVVVKNASNVILKDTEYEYNGIWRLLRKREKTIQGTNWSPNGLSFILSTPQTIVTNYQYNKAWQITKAIQPRWGQTSYQYNNKARLTKMIDSLWNSVNYEYNLRGLLIKESLISASGGIYNTIYGYDRDGRIISKTNNDWKVVSYQYNLLNQLIKKTDEMWNVTDLEYDFAWNLVKESRYLVESGSATPVVTSYEYDLMNELVKQTDAKWNAHSYSFDGFNRMIKETYPDWISAEYFYDANRNITKSIDPNGNVVNNVYDNLDRLTTRTINPAQWVWGVTREQYSYDALWRLISATDSQNQNIEFLYDGLDRVLKEKNSGKLIHYSYDNDSNLVGIIYPSKKKATRSFDIVDRLTNISWNAYNQNIAVLSNSYDSLFLKQTNFGNWAKSSYGYDNLLRNETINHYQSAFNSQNNANQIIDAINYDYDDVGNILSDGSRNYDYDSLYRIVHAVYPPSQAEFIKQEQWKYDLVWNRTSYDQRIDKNPIINQTNPTAPTPSSPSTNNWSNDNTNNGKHLWRYKNGKADWTAPVVWNGNNANSNSNTNNQTTPSSNWWNIQWWWTPWMLTFAGNSAYTVNNLNQYTTVTYPKNPAQQTTANLNYEKNWNLLEDDNFQYQYDYRNRLIRAKNKQNHEILTYKYDALNRRTEKTNRSKARKRIYTFHDVAEEDWYMNKSMSAWAIKVNEFVYGNWMDDLVYREQNKPLNYKDEQEEEWYTEVYTWNGFSKAVKRYFFQKDQAWSIKIISDSKWKVIEQYAYDAFGRAYEKDGASANYRPFQKSRVNNTRLYTAREYDADLSMFYYRNRRYSPSLWRFINRDPLWYYDDVNLYSYVGNNPATFRDPWGLAKEFLKVVNQVRDECKQNSNTRTLVKACVWWDFIREEKNICDLAWQIVCWEFPIAPDARDLLAATLYCERWTNCASEIWLASVWVFPVVWALKYSDEFMALAGKIGKNLDSSLLNQKNIQETLERIKQWKNKYQWHDWEPYKNSTNILPEQNNWYYKEYTVETPWIEWRKGWERIVVGEWWEIYYTNDHYKNFTRIK